MMLSPVNVEDSFHDVHEYWSPKIIGRINDQYVKAAKLKGSLVWHKHDEEEELFLVVRGELTIELEDAPAVTVRQGEFYVVPKGVRHNPVARDECWIVLIETVTTKHTGDIVVEGTRSIAEQLGQGRPR